MIDDVRMLRKEIDAHGVEMIGWEPDGFSFYFKENSRFDVFALAAEDWGELMETHEVVWDEEGLIRRKS